MADDVFGNRKTAALERRSLISAEILVRTGTAEHLKKQSKKADTMFDGAGYEMLV